MYTGNANGIVTVMYYFFVCSIPEVEGDPGMIIYFSDVVTIHNCLGLPTVATVVGAWGSHPWHLTSPTQGKKGKI